MNAVNIIVIGFNLGRIEFDCLQSIISKTHYPYVLTYYDNFKNKYTLTQIWNRLIRVSPCANICLLNNDTQVTDGWLTKMMDTLKNQPNCGFVGPSTNNCHSPQKAISSPEKAACKTDVVIQMKDPMSGFCLLFRRALWEELKGFDPKYKHYGQESDFIDRAHKQGWKSYWRQDAFVYHIGEASVKSSGMNAEAARTEAKKIYWSTRK
jgi:O-antigen biosynthesis protein